MQANQRPRQQRRLLPEHGLQRYRPPLATVAYRAREGRQQSQLPRRFPLRRAPLSLNKNTTTLAENGIAATMTATKLRPVRPMDGPVANRAVGTRCRPSFPFHRLQSGACTGGAANPWRTPLH